MAAEEERVRRQEAGARGRLGFSVFAGFHFLTIVLPIILSSYCFTLFFPPSPSFLLFCLPL
jgi:hypothetical protein